VRRTTGRSQIGPLQNSRNEDSASGTECGTSDSGLEFKARVSMRGIS